MPVRFVYLQNYPVGIFTCFSLCIEKLVGTDSKCPECGAFAWVKDMKTNRQLANTVTMCRKMRVLVGPDNNEQSDNDDDNNDVLINCHADNVSTKGDAEQFPSLLYMQNW